MKELWTFISYVVFLTESDSVDYFRQKRPNKILNAFRNCLGNKLDNVILPLYKMKAYKV